MKTEPTEEDFKRVLNKLKQDPKYDLHQELGQFLFRHIDDLSPDERKRYDELLILLKD